MVKSTLALLLILTGCSNPKDACEFNNGSRAFLGLPPNSCEYVKPVCPKGFKCVPIKHKKIKKD